MTTLKILPPKEAIAYFRRKGYRIGFSHLDVWQHEHQAAFTVAKAMQVDLLTEIGKAQLRWVGLSAVLCGLAV